MKERNNECQFWPTAEAVNVFQSANLLLKGFLQEESPLKFQSIFEVVDSKAAKGGTL